MSNGVINIKPTRKANIAEVNALNQIVYSFDKVSYIKSIGFEPFPWQEAVLKSHHKRIWIVATRQAGKSTIVSSVPCQKAKYKAGSLSVILAPTQDQAKEDMIKIKKFMSLDKNYPKSKHDNGSEIELVNGSRILVITASEESARGYSAPDVVIFDEASRIDDIVFASVFPMVTDTPDAVIYMLSTPHGKDGVFYKTMSSKTWDRYSVLCPWEIDPEDDNRIRRLTLTEEEYGNKMSKIGIHGYFSPRHESPDLSVEFLKSFTANDYKQEFCCEFIETEDQVFKYDQIEGMFVRGEEMGNVKLFGNIGESDQKDDTTVLNELFGA